MIGVAVAIFLFRPVPYVVERSITIDVPVEQSFAAIQDFNTTDLDQTMPVADL